jgi:hypothetical protein
MEKSTAAAAEAAMGESVWLAADRRAVSGAEPGTEAVPVAPPTAAAAAPAAADAEDEEEEEDEGPMLMFAMLMRS